MTLEAEVRGRRKTEVKRERAAAAKYDSGKSAPKTIFPLRLTTGQREDLMGLAEHNGRSLQKELERLVNAFINKNYDEAGEPVETTKYV